MFIEKTDRLALVDFDGKHYSYKDFVNNIKYFSENIINMEKEKFGLIVMENRKEWIFTFFGIWDRLSAPITIDALSNSKEILYILEDSNPEIVFCSNSTEKNVTLAVESYSLKDKIKVVNVDNYKIDEEILEKINQRDVILQNPKGDETAAMLYTSGTTGSPKGVMLSYNNFDSQIEGIYAKNLFDHKDQILAILPFHHVLPLSATILLMFRKQASVVLVEKVASKEILEALDKNNVTALIVVPRVLKLFYDAIMQQINAKKLTKFIYNTMTKVNSYTIKRKIFKKIHDKFGGELKFVVCGGAKLDPEIAKFYDTIGIYPIEGYGLTETSPVIAVNDFKNLKIGTVGKKLDGVEIKVVDEELWVKGGIVMKGYYNKPEKTAEVMTEDGWFKTGDVAKIDENGFVEIIGRKNAMIVLSNGKNIDPETVENRVLGKSNLLIKEIGIFGKNDKLAAIIVPELLEFKKKGITNIKTYIQNVIEDYNLTVHNYEKILDYKIYEEELPKTRVGKIRRFMLPELYEKGQVQKEKVEEPNNETYKMLKEYVKKVKGIEAGAEDNLELEIGMDSLDIVELFAYLENSFGVKINEEQFSDMPNLKLLSEYIEENATKMEDIEVDWKKIIDEVKPVPERNIWITKVLRPMLDLAIKGYFRLKRVNRDKIERKPQIFVSNHQSFIDSLVLGSLLPQSVLYNTMFLAINLYFKKGILKHLVKNGNVVLIDINNNIRQSVEEIAAHVKSGRNVLIFPEGARTKDGKVAKFKKVFAIIAKELDVDVQCLGIKGAFEAYSRFMKFPRPKKIEVAVLEKFEPKGTYDEIVEKAENIIRNYVEN